MATKGERQALLFLAGIALLGAGTRVYRARRDVTPNADLDRQIQAVDQAAGRGQKKERGSLVPRFATRIDVDTAAADEIDRLPGVGPAMAKRIVADRQINGPFGCLAALDVVKGIGPAMLAKLDTLVTFSGAPRQICGQR